MAPNLVETAGIAPASSGCRPEILLLNYAPDSSITSGGPVLDSHQVFTLHITPRTSNEAAATYVAAPVALPGCPCHSFTSGRSGRIRTAINGFGDRYAAVAPPTQNLIGGEGGIRTRSLECFIQSALAPLRLKPLGHLSKLAAKLGLEPRTSRLTAGRSTS